MKPPKLRTDWKTWLSVVLSVLSFLLSGFAFWYASLASADIKASLGTGLTFHFEGGEGGTPPGPGWTPMGLMVVATIGFANNGARVGEVNALELQLRDDDGTAWVFQPYKVVSDEQKLLDELSKNGPDRKWLEAVSSDFRSVVLPGKQITSQSIYFENSPKWSTNKIFGPSHRFHVTLYSLSPGERELRLQDQATIVVNRESTSLLAPNGSMSLPFEEIRDVFEKAHAKH